MKCSIIIILHLRELKLRLICSQYMAVRGSQIAGIRNTKHFKLLSKEHLLILYIKISLNS